MTTINNLTKDQITIESMKRNKSFDSPNPLYLIATPIGNLGEFSPRAIEVIKECDLVASEDTRNASNLLRHFDISKKTYSLREHNEKMASEYVIKEIKDGKKVVYMSDAGYPGISDPGYILVKECIANDINVSVINGSSAFLSALIPSGLDTTHFYFYGFMSAKKSEALTELETIKNRNETIIFYESPHRINDTLKTLYESLGNRRAVIARELTKLNEEFIRGTLEELTTIDPATLKGEMVIIVEGNKVESDLDLDKINATIALLKSKGLTNKDIVEVISKTLNINKNKISKLLY